LSYVGLRFCPPLVILRMIGPPMWPHACVT